MELSKHAKDISGQQFGRLTAIEWTGEKDNRRNLIWRCICACGNEKLTSGFLLRTGQTSSCGCLHIEVASKLNKLPDGESYVNLIFYRYKINAERRNLYFELTKNQLKSIINMNCHYCGKEPELKYNDKTKGLHGHKTNGVDRIDNSKGYIEGNVVPCCEICNRAKLKMSKEDFLSWVERVYNYQHNV